MRRSGREIPAAERDQGVVREQVRRLRLHDPQDRHGAALHLMRLGAEPLAGMPQAYVQVLFDQYAPRFESSLVAGKLGTALLFEHGLIHEGAEVTAGVKYVLRSDVMYGPMGQLFG